MHFLFKHPPGLGCSNNGVAPGIDIKGDGGYVIWWPAAGCEVVADRPLDSLPEWPAWVAPAAGKKAAERPAELVAPPSAGHVVRLLARMPNPLEADRDRYKDVALATVGCQHALAALDRCSPEEAIAIGEAFADWAERWDGHDGEDERGKWERDWSKRTALKSGWPQLLRHAMALGVDVGAERAEQTAPEFPPLPPEPPPAPR
jgi:hypothetical protein